MAKHSLLVSLAIATAGLAGCGANAPPVTYHAVDQAYVSRALAFYSGRGRIPPQQVKREVTPVVVHLPTMVCVGLNLKRGVAGGDTTLCYSTSTGRQVLAYVNGD